MKDLKIPFLITITFLIFLFLHKIFFQIKLPEIVFEFIISLSCLNFAIFSVTKININTNRKIWFLLSEWMIGFLLIILLNRITNGSGDIKFWFLVIFSSILGGVLTIINFAKTNKKTKIDLKKYLIILIPVSFAFPLISYLYFELIYQKTYYDLSFYVFIPEILIVIIWQIITFKNLK